MSDTIDRDWVLMPSSSERSCVKFDSSPRRLLRESISHAAFATAFTARAVSSVSAFIAFAAKGVAAAAGGVGHVATELSNMSQAVARLADAAI